MASGTLLTSCTKPEESNDEEEKMLSKIWEAKTIYHETVVLEDNGTEISGKLLYAPTEILSIKDYTLEKDYASNEYKIEGNKIIRTSESTMPFLTTEQLAGKNLPDGFGLSTYQAKEPGTLIVFTEGIGIVMHQIAVTYRHQGSWNAPKQSYQGDYLSNVITKLENKEAIKVVLNGDSISTGANSSGKLGIAPYLDDFGTLFVNKLKSVYSSEVELINTSQGGMLSSWGKENVDANINAYEPDLVIIGFGMNDGSWNIPTNKFEENIEFMIRSIQARNKNADIILLATIVANPISLQNSIQDNYLDTLNNLQKTYNVGVVDMTSLSKHLFETKKGVDILANNINHPSDFLVRCYAASLLTAMIKDY